MLNVIGRVLAILVVAGALITVTNYAVNSGALGGRFDREHEEHHEHRERDFDPNSLTSQYPALGVATGLLPTVIKIVGLGIVTVQVGNALNRRRRARKRLA